MKHITDKTEQLLRSRRVIESVVILDREGVKLSFNGKHTWSTHRGAMASINTDCAFLAFHSPAWRTGLEPQEQDQLASDCIAELLSDGHIRIVVSP